MMNERFGRGKRTEKIHLRIEPEIKEMLGDLAFEEEITISDYVRTLILEELKQKKMLKRQK